MLARSNVNKLRDTAKNGYRISRCRIPLRTIDMMHKGLVSACIYIVCVNFMCVNRTEKSKVKVVGTVVFDTFLHNLCSSVQASC